MKIVKKTENGTEWKKSAHINTQQHHFSKNDFSRFTGGKTKSKSLSSDSSSSLNIKVKGALF